MVTSSEVRCHLVLTAGSVLAGSCFTRKPPFHCGKEGSTTRAAAEMLADARVRTRINFMP